MPDNWIFSVLTKTNTCGRCGVQVLNEYVATHDYYHTHVERLGERRSGW